MNKHREINAIGLALVWSFTRAALLRKKVRHAEEFISRTVAVELNDNQFSALVSLVLDIGVVDFINSTMLLRLNGGDHFDQTPAEFSQWIKHDRNQLEDTESVRRREAELDLYLS